MQDKTLARRHRAHEEVDRAALGGRILGPTAEEREGRRAAKSRRLRKLRRKAQRAEG